MKRRTSKEIEELFWSRIHIKTKKECWNFQGGKHEKGYGHFWNGFRIVKAHRFAYESHNKCKIPKGLNILHKCDTPSCCNPSHLYEGTQVENMEDMFLRKGGRTNSAKISFSRAKFYAGEIWLIRRLRGLKQSDIAKMFKTSSQTIGNILRATKYPCREGYYA